MLETAFINKNDSLAMENNANQYNNGMYCYNYTSKQTSPVRSVTKTAVTNATTCQSNTHQKKSRTVFTKKQILRLESVFYEKRYLTIKDREELSKSLSLTESQVKVWFQNRRNKWKREMAFKVEYAKFNILPNHNLASGRIVDGNLPNMLVPPLPATSPQASDLATSLENQYDLYNRGYYNEQYNYHQQQQYQSMLNQGSSQGMLDQGSPNSYSPVSNGSSCTHEINYQETAPANLLNTHSVTDEENCNVDTGNMYASLSNTHFERVPTSHYESGILPNSCEYGINPAYIDMTTTHYNSHYENEDGSPNTIDVNTTVMNAPTLSGTTGVVYTTLTDCRYGDTHTLQLPNQQFEYNNSY